MAQQMYYPGEILVEKMQSGEYGWLDYISRFSAEWQGEYTHYCEAKGLMVCEDSAAGFVRSKDEQLEVTMKHGNA